MLNDLISSSVKLVIFTSFFIPLYLASYQGTGQKDLVILVDGGRYVGWGPTCFCYRNSIVPTWWETWTKIVVQVESSGLFKVYTVEGEDKLEELDHFSLWSWFFRLIRKKHNEITININLYRNNTYFKIDPTQNSQYFVHAIRKFDIFSFTVFVVGGFLFIFASSLSRSQFFFYSVGMSTGMIASLLIFFFVLSRFLPKKSPFYLLIVGGWSFSLYIIQFVGRNLCFIFKEHWQETLAYVVVVGFISFSVCYHYGPLVDQKSINILTWTLQVFGLLLIYLGIKVQAVAFAIIIATLVSKNLEYLLSVVIPCFRRIKRFLSCKPVPRRLLTEEEYVKEAEVETQRALEDLRKYCKSPECPSWKIVTRLQSPRRFADFVEGYSHVASYEMADHNQMTRMRKYQSLCWKCRTLKQPCLRHSQRQWAAP